MTEKDIIGVWNCAAIASFGENGISYLTIEQYRALPNEEKDPDMLTLCTSRLTFNPDGTVSSDFAVPEGATPEQLAEAEAEGQVIKDGRIIDTTYKWRIKNDCLQTDSEGDWANSTLSPDGILELGMMRYCKAGSDALPADSLTQDFNSLCDSTRPRLTTDDVIGEWRVAFVDVYDDGSCTEVTADEYLNRPADKQEIDLVEKLRSKYVLLGDGTLRHYRYKHPDTLNDTLIDMWKSENAWDDAGFLVRPGSKWRLTDDGKLQFYLFVDGISGPESDPDEWETLVYMDGAYAIRGDKLQKF